jgi:hypothetical protein
LNVDAKVAPNRLLFRKIREMPTVGLLLGKLFPGQIGNRQDYRGNDQKIAAGEQIMAHA